MSRDTIKNRMLGKRRPPKDVVEPVEPIDPLYPADAAADHYASACLRGLRPAREVLPKIALTEALGAAGVRRLIAYESNLEKRVLLVLLARRDVVEVREQVAPISYKDEAGRTRKHYFDFWIRRKDGRKSLVAVMRPPEARAVPVPAGGVAAGTVGLLCAAAGGATPGPVKVDPRRRA